MSKTTPASSGDKTTSQKKARQTTGGLFRDDADIDRSDDLLNSEYTTGYVIKRIWREHMTPHRRLLLIATIAMLTSAATTGAVPLLIQRATREIFINHNQMVVYPLAIAVLIVTLLKTSSEYISKVTVNYLGNRFVADMRISMFRRLIHADLSWIEGVHSGRFVSGFLTDAVLLRDTASRAMMAVGENLLKVVVLTITMFVIDWRLAMFIVMTMPIGVFLLSRQRKKMRTSTKKSLAETGDLSALVTQALRSARVVRAYGQNEAEIKRTSNVIERALEFTMRGQRAKALTNPIAELMTGIGFALVIVFAGSFKSGDASMSPEHFMGFAAAAMLMFQPLRSLATLQTTIEEGATAAARVFGIIDQKSDQTDPENAGILKVEKGLISFDKVSFSYEDGAPVLKNLGIDVPAGKTVALVGPSGAGKSTVLNLALRFFDLDSGRILIDGQNIASVTLESLRAAIGLVTQDPILFDDTIRANIAYGRPEASQAEIEAAAKAAAAHDFISALPKGYDTSVREAGNALSGGERQRIAIARAVLKDAPILLLDEPTSSLDSQSEAKVQAALEQLMKGRTVLMIAHRLATVRHADIIYVLKKGELFEHGDHNALIAQNGLYAELCRQQALLD